MSDFFSLVQKLNAINNDEQVDITPSVETTTKRKEIAETATLLSKFNEISDANPYQPVVEAEEVDTAAEIRQRYSDFMKSEVAQGNDLSTVATAVSETNINAAKLDRAFNSTYKVMEQLLDITAEGGKLEGNVIAEGGDHSYIQAANLKIAEALDALKEAHMYAVKQIEEE